MKPEPPWEKESGIQVLRLYKSQGHPEWAKPVNKADLHPDWPQVVLLDLTTDQYKEFLKDPKAFANKHNLFPQAVRRISTFPKPRKVKGGPGKADLLSYTLVAVHNHDSTMGFTAGNQNEPGSAASGKT